MLSQIQEMRKGGVVENRIISIADQVCMLFYDSSVALCFTIKVYTASMIGILSCP